MHTTPGQLALFNHASTGPPQPVPARRARRRKTTRAEMSARFDGADRLRLTFAPGLLWPWLAQIRPELVREHPPATAPDPHTGHVHVDHGHARYLPPARHTPEKGHRP